MLPWEVKRVIFLDVDIVIYEDLSHLWAIADNPSPPMPDASFRQLINPKEESLGRFNLTNNMNNPSLDRAPVVFWVTRNGETPDNWYSNYGIAHYTVEYFIQVDDEHQALGEQGYIDNWCYYYQDRVIPLPCHWNKRGI